VDDPALEQAIAAARPAAHARDAVLAAVRRRMFATDAAPETIAHYVVERRLGQGGMGVVWAARDPRLGRTVALKLLRGSGPRERLLREAQALARLAHPNVVEIYDVGAHGNRVYLAMELVDGPTLGSWLATTKPHWRAVLEVFLAAGRGLQAAHDAGLVHRDFKPHNVMIGPGSRVRVMDFGLAHAVQSASDDASSAEIEPPHAEAPPWLSLTSTGERVGTPAYMAPEQHDGGPIDARTDQFGFCAALHEALLGVAPFRATTLRELAADKREGRISPPPAGHGVPRALLAVIRRGLAADPAARHPSMDALLDALHRTADAGRRRLRVAITVGAGSAALLLATSLGGRAACDDEVTPMFGDGQRAGVVSAFHGAPLAYADEAGTRTLAALDEHAAAWRAASIDACERFETGSVQRERAQACLQRDRQRFAALVESFASGDADVLGHAAEAVLELHGPADCLSADATAGGAVAVRGELAARVEGVRERLAEVWVLQHVGRWAEARSIAEALLDDAAAREHAPIAAEIERVLGDILLQSGEHAAAEDMLSRAYFDALDGGEPRIAAEAATLQVMVVGAYLARHDDALDWARHAEAALALAPFDASLAAELDCHVGVVHNARGEVDLAQAEYRDAIAKLADRPAGDTRLATAMQYLGLSYVDEGRYAEARELLARVVEAREAAFGPHHVVVAAARVNLANALTRAGELRAALAEHDRALAIQEAVLGPRHVESGVQHNNLGSVLDALGQAERAHDEHSRALSVFEETLGAEHPYVGATLVNLGRIDVKLGRLDRAERELERARTLLERVLGGDHPHVAYALLGLGELEVARGDSRRALAVLGEGSRGCPGAEPLLCAELGFATAQAHAGLGDAAAAGRVAADARAQAGAGGAADELRARIDAWSRTQ
jgi:tetratricopeptide (TPR) repeat protein/predicted Ser/Thr protein kinase